MVLMFSLCLLVWVLMGLLPVCIYRMRRSVLKWLLLLAMNAALWCLWAAQYRVLAANPAWAKTGVREGLLLVEAGGGLGLLFLMMFLERGRIRKRHLARLEWDG